MRSVFVLILCLLPTLASAQGNASLVANDVFLTAGDAALIAQGNVEVFYDGTRLTAQRITFDQTNDSLVIEGPIFITYPDGTIITADDASMDPQLRNGILRAGRLVLNDQLQLAANQVDRVDGRYTQLYQAAVTSCRICTDGGTPLWEIRARRVIHDRDEQQLYFDDATFRVLGVPLLWLPYLRLPDPTLNRATGLMIPRLVSSADLGTGLKLPYFIRLGDHRDLTLTPYLSTSTSTLEADYRQAFVRGNINIEGAVTRDDLVDDLRAYVFLNGIFDLGEDIILRFDAEYVSDDAYLLEYGYSGKDRLDSAVSLERVRDRDLTQAKFTYFSSLRAGALSEPYPPVLLDLSWERRVTPDWGGTLTFASDLQSHYRETSTLDTGRDVSRIGVATNWHRNEVTGVGIVVDGTVGINLDYYNVSDDSDTGDTFRSTVFGQTTLRYPLIRTSQYATHVIEPMVQLAWSAVDGGKIENEDSRATELDQANLLAISRFSGEDAVEEGLRGALGLTWTRLGQEGYDTTLTLGRVFRDETDPAFSATSSLGNTSSDWLIAGQISTPAGLSLDTRLIVNTDYDITKTETRAGWVGPKLSLTTGYIFLPTDLEEDRTTDVGELAINSTYRFNSTWTVGFDARYDVLAKDPTSANLEIGWQNECVTVDFSVSRRFTSSTTITPSTDFGLAIGLNGFSTGRSVDVAPHRCTK